MCKAYPIDSHKVTTSAAKEANLSGPVGGLAYALWRMVHHLGTEGPWGALLAETRSPGYDGPLTN